MTIEKKPFKAYREEEERAKDKRVTFTLSMNKEEYKQLQKDKELIEQTRDSTAVKQLANVGAIVLRDKKTRAIIDTLFINKRRNKRQGIPDFD